MKFQQLYHTLHGAFTKKTHVSFNQYKTCSATRTQPYTETKAACNGVDVWTINHMPLLIRVLVQIDLFTHKLTWKADS